MLVVGLRCRHPTGVIYVVLQRRADSGNWALLGGTMDIERVALMPTDEVPDVYVDLAERFLDGELTADDFSLAVVKTYKRENSFFEEAEAQAMNELFYAAEGFCGDAELRDEGDLDEQHLVDAVADFLVFVKQWRPDA